eukprot:scaffold4120_cov400-Prasinococcus_capsulatus_cf.AAC.17
MLCALPHTHSLSRPLAAGVEIWPRSELEPYGHNGLCRHGPGVSLSERTSGLTERDQSNDIVP